FSSLCPSNARMVILSEKDRNLVLTRHNELRQLWANGFGKIRGRSACKMATMEWDENLAKLAELNVKRCELDHDVCHNTPAFRHSGQNMGLLGYSGSKVATKTSNVITEIFNDWAEEDFKVTALNLDRFPMHGDKIGHFTTLINEKNVAVGCAIVNYAMQNMDFYLMTCNYAKANTIGRRVYKFCSLPGSKCPNGLNPTFSPLC
ncbi:hypothetical protein KR018_007628, partial [Drosophila ironensis]